MKFQFPPREVLEDRCQDLLPVEQKEYLIDGLITRWPGETQPVFSPVCYEEDGKVERLRIGSFPSLTGSEGEAALDAARRAYDRGNGPWPTSTLKHRVECMENFLHMMSKRREDVVRLLMWEIGKNRGDSEKEFDRTVKYIRDTIESVKDMDRRNSRPTTVDGIVAQIRRAPMGIVLCLGPYNYPLNETFALLIPALIMGNTVILKPPRYGVLLLGPLLEAFAEAFPPGVINVIFGEGEVIVPPIMESGDVDVLAFIGGSRVASLMAKMHPKPNRLRHVLGLEAKNPAIVLPDVDLDLAVKECISGTLSFNGQRCTALKILFVHKAIRREFLWKFSNALDELKKGLPWEDGVFVTPLPEADKPAYLTRLMEEAVEKGAEVVNEGGGQVTGTYFHPAVVFPVTPEMELYHVEQFGPLIPVAEFENIEEPLEYLQNSNYGQQVSVFGSSPKQIARLVDGLVNQVCRVNINSQCQRGPDVFPFTGRKDSAQITLSVHDALRAFSIRTMAAFKQNQVNTEILEEVLDKRHSNFINDSWIV